MKQSFDTQKSNWHGPSLENGNNFYWKQRKKQ